MQVKVNGGEQLNRENQAKDGDEGRGGSRKPTPGERTIDLKSAYEAARVDHQHAEADEDGGESDAEGHNQEESQAYPVQGKRTQENDERCRAWNDSAGDTQRQELSQTYGVDRSRAATQRIALRLFVCQALPEHPVTVSLARSMRMIRGVSAQPAQQHIAAEPRNCDSGKNAEPRVELLGHDVPRRV